MSGLVSYSYDPSSDQELSDSPYESQPSGAVKKEQSETQNRQVYSERRERERSRGEEEERPRREREYTSRKREREYSSPHRKSHKHRKHRKSRHSSSDSDSPDKHRSKSYKKSSSRHSRSPRRRHEDRDHSERSYRSRRGYSPPRTITSAKSPPSDSKSVRQGGQKGDSYAPEQNKAKSSASMRPGNPYGMSQQRFKDLQNKKKMLWSKDSEEDGSNRNSGSVYIAATNSLQVAQDKKDKFSKMMGLKSSLPPNPPSQPHLLQYNKTQDDLQKQYDESRVQTHMMKGSGLGYGNIYQA